MNSLHHLCHMDRWRKTWCEYKLSGRGYYHLCSDGWKSGCLFYKDSQYAFGMSSMAICSLLFDVIIYAFELMPNHFHVILSGTGADCCKLFFYMKKRISARLKKDGYVSLPAEYGFKLIPIWNEQQLKNNLLYVARNPYEKHLSAPGGYPWGSGYLNYSPLSKLLKAEYAGNMSVRRINRLTGSRISLPGHWLINEDLGILPVSFVETSKVYKLFPVVKDYCTQLVKDYEAFARIASDIGEEIIFDEAETRDIVRQVLQNQFGGKQLRELEKDGKYRLIALLHTKFGLDVHAIARGVYLPETIVRQVWGSKDYGIRQFREAPQR